MPVDKGRQMTRSLNAEETVTRLAAAVPFLLAAAGTSLNAGVPYYGPQLPDAEAAELAWGRTIKFLQKYLSR
jgi:dienelactone hydrolase